MSSIKELGKKYNLDPKIDFWKHQQSGKWIVTHDAVEKIAVIEDITLAWNAVTGEPLMTVIESGESLFICRVTMQKGNRYITTFGEASPKNCQSRYLAAMAEKRAYDRAILKMINAYQYGIYSEEEADTFSKDKNIAKVKSKKAEPLLTTAQGKTIMILEGELMGKIKPIDFTGLTQKDADLYIQRLHRMKDELSEV